MGTKELDQLDITPQRAREIGDNAEITQRRYEAACFRMIEACLKNAPTVVIRQCAREMDRAKYGC